MNVPLLWARVAPHQLDAKLYCHLVLWGFALLQFGRSAGGVTASACGDVAVRL